MEFETQSDIPANEYFSSYEDLEIHRLMLEDEQRTEAYRKAILSNSLYFKGKIVMDVGCGTGILSIFCAQAGAKKVFAVEASNVANLARETVKDNKFEDIIEVINSKVEDVVLPENLKVDAIVSEWMGFYLLHEGMLDSVLIARNKFLKADGEMFPENAAIYIAPCSIPSLYSKWDSLYDVSLASFAKKLRASKYNKPEIINVQPQDIIGNEVALCWIDLKEDDISQVDSFSIKHVVGASKTGLYQGLCVWFECNFPVPLEKTQDSGVTLDTSPHSPPTHWKQTVIVLPQQQEVEQGEPIAFQLDMNRDLTNNRRYNLELTLLDPETTEHPIPCFCDMTKCILAKAFMEQNAQNILKKKTEEGSILEEDNIDDDED